ncbi:LLM class flavin-dependent oxidoreductase [Mycobacterium sp.]|uniref:LLM class flavin-dependent oxidoreductase n=1 Tax=Mycobacterium sp. TaxID=1785 RepID=UPI0025F7BD25|nr:LLM class flavin-dependent oxidoreductase [Mycobacterium sp.]
MPSKTAETAVFLWGDRNAPASVTVEAAKTAAASGGVDGFAMSDQLVNFIPPSLWTPENTPLADFLPDPDSMDDAFSLAAYVYASTPGMNLTLLTDSIRNGPAQLVHAMLTLAKITEGRVTFLIGGGEVKQCNPFGWKRSQGLSRLEDLYKIFRKFMDSDRPISHEGNHWNLDKAFLGAAKQYRPKVWGLGGGPKILDLSTSHSDGFAGAAPCVWATPEDAAEYISKLKADVAAKGRDPERYRVGALIPVLVHDDEEVIERALDNRLVRWIGAIFGRTQPLEWRRHGIEPAVPDGWTYFMKMKPHDTPPAFADEVVAKATRRMTELSYIWGNTQQVASQIQAYVDAGVDWVSPVDYLPIVSDPSEGEASLARTIEICSILKAAVAVT